MLQAKVAGGDAEGLFLGFVFLGFFAGGAWFWSWEGVNCNSVPLLWVKEPHFFQRRPKVRDHKTATDKPDKFLGAASAESGKGEGPTC